MHIGQFLMNSRGASIKTRIETGDKYAQTRLRRYSRGASIKTRIETAVNASASATES